MDPRLVQEEVRRAAGLSSPARTAEVIEVCLAAVGRRLPSFAARLVAAELPAPWAAALVDGAGEVVAERIDRLYDEVSEALEVGPGPGLELTTVVFHHLGAHLSVDARAILERELPPAWSRLFAPAEEAVTLPRSGGEGLPPQRASVARGLEGPEKNRLSSGQPRTTSLAEGRVSEGEKLSEARPGSHHALSEGRSS